MPWDAQSMMKKGAKSEPAKAARMANHILAASGNEGMAIATALKASNKKTYGRHRKLFPTGGKE